MAYLLKNSASAFGVTRLLSFILLLLLLARCDAVKEVSRSTTTVKIDTAVTIPERTIKSDSLRLSDFIDCDSFNRPQIVRNITYKTEGGSFNIAGTRELVALEATVDSMLKVIQGEKITTSETISKKRESKVNKALMWGAICLLLVLGIVVVIKFF